MKKKQIIGLVVAAALFVGVSAASVFTNNISKNLLQSSVEDAIDLGGSYQFDPPSGNYIAIVRVEGTIQEQTESSVFETSSGYQHDSTMNYIDELMDDENNKGILLYVDSPGGTVYESEELYLKLKEYKEKTKRPVYAYFASQACSGGYYVSMAADKIYANRNCWTGSIGVIVSLTNCKKLYDKLGIKEIDITSGKNKSMGSAGLELTDEQYDILQSLVDEAYDQFTGIVSEGRKMDIKTVKKLADGRIYSALQAKENGLIDETGSLDDLKKVIQKENKLSEDITYFEPENDASAFLKGLFGYANKFKSKSDTELAVDIMENKGNGVLMYYAD